MGVNGHDRLPQENGTQKAAEGEERCRPLALLLVVFEIFRLHCILIRLPLRSFLSDLPESISIKKFELGTINSAALSFTDACLVNGMIYFLAAGERTESTYLDGEFAGAILGKMTLEGEILEKEVLAIDHKPEGIAFYKGSFYFVTDADDRSKASSLLSASF